MPGVLSRKVCAEGLSSQGAWLKSAHWLSWVRPSMQILVGFEEKNKKKN